MVRKKSFLESSYLSQVRRLRRVADLALRQYRIVVGRVEFIHHGENTTFKVTDVRGKRFLLRIHRRGYHSQEAIQEEMTWLAKLSKAGMCVPTPVPSRKHEWVVNVSHADADGNRDCTVFRWREGRFLHRGIRPDHLFEIGSLLGKIHNQTPYQKTRHRRYWDAEGLVGAKPKLGSLDHLQAVTPAQQRIITQYRRLILRRLCAYEKKHPRRMGLIHADLHFGNLLVNRGQLIPIDFDDCGFGFLVADLVVPWIALQNINSSKSVAELADYRAALISGYQSQRAFDLDDEKIFAVLEVARNLTFLGWLNSRRDNPRLVKVFPKVLERTLLRLKTEERSKNYKLPASPLRDSGPF